MKTKKEIEDKLKESEDKLDSNKYTTYSERRKLFDWVNILNWVLNKE